MTASRPRTAMILAAGRGERMRPLTDVTPKPLLRIHGKPLIERHVERLARCGIEAVVINLAWLGGQIRDYLGDGSRYGVAIRYSDEGPRALETGGGVFRALPLLDPAPFLVVAGDIYTDYPFEQLTLGAAHDARLVLVPNPPQHPHGDFALRGEFAAADGEPRFTFAGIAAYRPELFTGCTDGTFPLKPLLVLSMTAQRCAADLYTGQWEDVGTPERLEALDARPE